MDANRSFREAHRIVENVREDLERAIPNAIVTIHADPWPELPSDSEKPTVVQLEAPGPTA